MSDTPLGGGWWQASDGKWYPPQSAQPPQPAARSGCASAMIAVGIVVGGLFFLLMMLIIVVTFLGRSAEDEVTASGGGVPEPEITTPQEPAPGPQPSAPPSRPVLDAAVLGGTPAAFDRELGERAQPGSEGSDLAIYTYLPCDGRKRPQISIGFLYGVANTVNYGPCRQRVLTSLDEAQREAERYFPPGTRKIRDTVTGDGERARVFRSAELAKVYDERIPQFQDCDSNPVEPGTFTLVIMENDWFMTPGTCP